MIIEGAFATLMLIWNIVVLALMLNKVMGLIILSVGVAIYIGYIISESLGFKYHKYSCIGFAILYNIVVMLMIYDKSFMSISMIVVTCLLLFIVVESICFEILAITFF
jgi:hypothetical protein